MTRRNFLKSSGALAALGFAGSTYAWQIEPFWLEFVHITMPIPNLPAELSGKTLMQISDTHVGLKFDTNYLINSFKSARKFQPDFVVYTGDFLEYQSDEQYQQLEDVFEYAVLGKEGTYGALGNHDYGPEAQFPDIARKTTNILQRKGIHILRNEQIDHHGLNFIGVDDFWSPRFNPELALRDMNNKEGNIALCHNPDAVDFPEWAGYNSWILSGHTHGGQCKVPFMSPPVLPVKNKRYVAGQYDLFDGRTLYVNRALGHLWQVRFNVRPEITIFHLETA